MPARLLFPAAEMKPLIDNDVIAKTHHICVVLSPSPA